MYASLSDEETIRQLLPSQPSQCFEALYSRYVKKVYQRCLSMTRDAEQAEDFTQDIFLKVFNKLDAFQERSSFSTWLYSISYNYCADQLRLAKRLPTTSWEEAGIGHNTPDEEETQLHEETLQVVQQAMTTLSVEERTFLRLKYEDGMSIEELAQLYNLKPSAVKMRLKRSREKVKSLCVQQCLS